MTRATRKSRRSKPRQVEIAFRTWGGKRKGAGRKRGPGPTRVTHRSRPALATRFPVHVSLKVNKGLPNLRAKACIKAIERALIKARTDGRIGTRFRVVHYCVQRNHIHLVVEALGAEALSRGMQGLTIRIAKALNKVWGRTGSVFADRYHGHILRTPAETRAALNYVLNNSRRHDRQQKRCATWLDPCSSAIYLDGWRGFTPQRPQRPSTGPPVASASTWLLRKGWRRHGLLVPDATPGPPA